MDAAYAQSYRDLYERHWWWRAREAFLVDALRRQRPARGWPTILDVGCGDGLLFDRLLEFGDVEGVEADAGLVSTHGRHRARIHVGPFDEFRPAKRYALILMLDVLEHLRNPAAALRHAVELLEPDGTLLITVPAFRMLWTTHDDLNHHLTRYTRDGLIDLVRTGGLEIATARYFFHWLFAAKLALRMVEAATHPPPSAPRVPPRPINRTLYALSRLEHRLFAPLPIPFGSSLLLVARKAP